MTGRVCAKGNQTELVARGTELLSRLESSRGGEDAPAGTLLGPDVLTQPGSVPASVACVPDSITSCLQAVLSVSQQAHGQCVGRCHLPGMKVETR